MPEAALVDRLLEPRDGLLRLPKREASLSDADVVERALPLCHLLEFERCPERLLVATEFTQKLVLPEKAVFGDPVE